jgi:hypothetical protein
LATAVFTLCNQALSLLVSAVSNVRALPLTAALCTSRFAPRVAAGGQIESAKLKAQSM